MMFLKFLTALSTICLIVYWMISKDAVVGLVLTPSVVLVGLAFVWYRWVST